MQLGGLSWAPDDDVDRGATDLALDNDDDHDDDDLDHGLHHSAEGMGSNWGTKNDDDHDLGGTDDDNGAMDEVPSVTSSVARTKRKGRATRIAVF